MTNQRPSPPPGPRDERDAARKGRVRQARAWAIAMDPVYGLIGMGLIGWLIDRWAGTEPRWMTILAITGLIGGFYRFISEAMRLNRDNTKKWAGRPYRQIEPDPEPGEDPRDDREGELSGDENPQN